MSRRPLIDRLETRNSASDFNYRMTNRDIVERMMQERKIDPNALKAVSQFLNPKELSAFGATSVRRLADVKNIQTLAKNKFLSCKKKMQNGKKCLKNIHPQNVEEDKNSEKSCQEWCRAHIKNSLEKELLEQLKVKCASEPVDRNHNQEHVIPLDELRQRRRGPYQPNLLIEGAIVVVTENCNPREYQNYFISGVLIWIELGRWSGDHRHRIDPENLEDIGKLIEALKEYLALQNQNKTLGEESKEIKEYKLDENEVLTFEILKMVHELEKNSSYEVKISKTNEYSPIAIQINFKPLKKPDQIWEFLYKLFRIFENNIEDVWNQRLEQDCLLRANVFMNRRQNNGPIEIKIRLNDSPARLSITLVPPREPRRINESKRISYAQSERKHKAENWKYYLTIENASIDLLEEMENFIDDYSSPPPTLTRLSSNSEDRELLGNLDLLLNLKKDGRDPRSEIVKIDSLDRITVFITTYQEPNQFLCQLATTFPYDSLIFPDLLAETFKFLGSEDIYTIGGYHEPIRATDLEEEEREKEYQRYVSRLEPRY